MEPDSRLDELLSRWEELWGRGQAVTAEDLCRDCPELLEAVRWHVQALGPVGPPPGPTPITTDEAVGAASEAGAPPPGLLLTRSHYRVLRPHARGGLGEVMLAHDEDLDRDVALKLIQKPLDRHPERRARFLREAEITSRLEHPGVVPVYGVGEDAEGRPCYAMRFVQGETLQEALGRFHAADRPGRDPGERTLALRGLLGRFVGVCNAVAYAHSKGVIHRDLKPANIMLGPYGESLVVDWGLARQLDAGGAGDGGDGASPERAPAGGGTATGLVLGTPAYMSPEQAEGRRGAVGPTSDIYSLGATLYALLTGRAPFQRDSPGALLDRVRRGDFPTPRRVKPGTPAALEAVCLKALALRPAGRYATALALAADVEHWLADEPLSAYRDPPRVRVGRWVRRHRTAVTGAAALLVTGVVALAVGFVLVTQEQAETERQRREAVAEGERADINARAANDQRTLALASARVADTQRDLALTTLQGLVGIIQQTLADKPGTQALRRQLLRQTQQGLERVVRSAETAARVDWTTAQTHFELGNIARHLGVPDQAGRHYEAGRKVAQAMSRADPAARLARRALATAHTCFGDLLVERGDGRAARQEYDQAAALRQALAEGQPPDAPEQAALADSLGQSGRISTTLGDFRKAHAALSRAVALREALAGAHPRDALIARNLCAAYNHLARLHATRGDAKGAGKVAASALRLAEQVLLADPESLQARRNLSSAHESLGDAARLGRDFKGARDAYRKAVDLRQALARADPAHTVDQASQGMPYLQLCDMSLLLGDAQTADEASRKLVEIYEAALRADPTNTLARNNLAFAYARRGHVSRLRGDAAAARREYDRALALRQAVVQAEPASGRYQRDLGDQHRNLGDLNMESGDFRAAGAAYRKALDIAAALARTEPGNGRYLGDLVVYIAKVGDASVHLKDFKAAEASYRKALEIQLAVSRAAPRNDRAREHLWLSYYKAASLTAHLGRHQEAIGLAEEMYAVLPNSTNVWYNMARCYAQCLPRDPGRGLTAVQEVYARRTVRLLERCRAAGRFRTPAHVANLKEDFATLGARPAFQALVRALEAGAPKGAR